MGLIRQVKQAFAPQGPLAQSVSDFRPRAGQLEMAEAVAQTLQDGGALVVEAGTGVGKTYAYLLPVLLAGEPALVSTATKALQDQLFNRDLPHLLRTLGLPLRTALLKGRSSYLCQYRLEQARQSPRLLDADLQMLARVEHWAPTTVSGDLAELDGLDESAALVPLVTSTRDNCLGARCVHAQACHVNRARRQAMVADVVVVNHHLFFADWQVRESGVAELLPAVRTVVFDEAHQLQEIGAQFLGSHFSSGQLDILAGDLERAGVEFAAGLAPWKQWAVSLREQVAALGQAGTRLAPGRYALDPVDESAGHEATSLTTCVAALAQAGALLGQLAVAMEPVALHRPEIQALAQRTGEWSRRVAAFAGACPTDHARWLEIGARTLQVFEAPLDLAASLGAWVRDTGVAGGKSWIFTSATLGHEPTLSWFVQSCGLQGARVLRVQSPFDFESQAALYVPRGLVDPHHPGHPAAVAEVAAMGAVRLGGRTLVLTTTLKSMRQIGDLLKEELRHRGIDVLVQGQGSKRSLLQRFQHAATSPGKGAVLVASVSFWEGIDLPGDDLQLLVIDKLPFSPPDDPLQRARARTMEARGLNAFKEMHMPLAAIALKQGAGRLIRRETDYGVLVICDVRLRTKPYGRTLLDALPPMRRLDDSGAYQQALGLATRSSTRDRPSDAPPW